MPMLPSAIVTDKIPAADPSGASTASLVLIHPPMADVGLRRPLIGDVIVVGREDCADFTVARTAISRRHAEIRRVAGGAWVVADMGSTNGTFLNEEPVDDALLNNGDHLQFGDAIFKFVTGKAAMEFHDQMYRLTELDGLTALYNQRYFSEYVYEQMAKAKHVHSDMAMLVLDIDCLSETNEDSGRACGDVAIKAVAKCISKTLGKEHIAARVGGGEFAVFLRGHVLDEALQLAEELREAIAAQTVAFGGARVAMSVCVGVAASAEGELEAPQISSEARRQMVAAKERGKNCICP
ncbi:MAG: GGDEF domain-containing protein [Kofleriaceae bacterium]|nr:GGDEF domain-containing protein [Kofleriaceae bacterium]